jgi:hypothetical protein
MQFLYLARRDRKHVEVLGIMQNKSIHSEKKLITNSMETLSKIGDEYRFKINNYAYSKRMDYDLFIQDFAHFDHFKTTMLSQGYKGLPSGLQPLFFTLQEQAQKINRPKSNNTMMQRKSKFS